MSSDTRRDVLSSWLEKQAEWRFAWDKRFFVQDGLRLSYSLSPTAAEKQVGYIMSLQRGLGPSQPHGFRVWLEEGGCWTLRAATAEAHEQWTRSICAALVQDGAAQQTQQKQNLRDTREGPVMKKAAWSGEWRERYVEIDGFRLTYRVRKGEPVRGRFIVVAVDTAATGDELLDECREGNNNNHNNNNNKDNHTDKAEEGEVREEEEEVEVEMEVEEEDTEPRDACALLITASTGERFWLRLATRTRCADWVNTLQRSLRRAAPWHWHSLAPSAETQRLRTQFHAAAVAAVGRRVYCFGGSATVGTMRARLKNSATAAAQWGIEREGEREREKGPIVVMRGLSVLRLAGEHKCVDAAVRPFEESAHAKRCPPPAMGAGLCIVASAPSSPRHSVPSSNSSCMTHSNSVTSSNSGIRGSGTGCAVLFGGRDAQEACRDAFSEMWCFATGVRVPRWHMHRYTAAELPHRSFHTIVSRGPRAALIVGGIDDADRACAECFSIEWPPIADKSDEADEMFATRPLVQLCAYLPEPRAFHACVALHDDSLVVIGGHNNNRHHNNGIHDGDVIVRLARGSADWHRVAAEPPLPPLRTATAAVCDPCDPLGPYGPFPGAYGTGAYGTGAPLGSLRVFVLGAARLFQVVFAEGDPTRAATREIAMEVGAVPRRCCGATLHCAGGYLYAIGGGGGGGDDGEEEAPLRDPVRAIIGDQ